MRSLKCSTNPSMIRSFFIVFFFFFSLIFRTMMRNIKKVNDVAESFAERRCFLKADWSGCTTRVAKDLRLFHLPARFTVEYRVLELHAKRETTFIR